MSATSAPRTAAAVSDEEIAALAAAVRRLPRFLRSPISLPTERVPPRAAISGLEQVRALYEHDLDRTHRPRLRALRGARSGRRCFIIGKGPSLSDTDLGKLRSETTFATDGFFLKMPELDWVPTYYVVEDQLLGEDRAEELQALAGPTKLFPASLAYALRPDEHTIYFDHRPRKRSRHGFDFSFDADVNTYTGGTVTYTCMQLAAYLGFQEIYLVGMDADDPIPVDAAGAFAEARRATESRGISIVNATVGGNLEVFPRIDFDALFRAKPTERLLVIDHTLIGNGTATGEVKAAILGNWPANNVMQVYDRSGGRLRIAGGPVDVDDTTSLMKQVGDFDPDLILYRPVPHTEALHDFTVELLHQTNLALAVWIVDDWPTAYALKDPVAATRLDADFRALLERADARFSISPAMSAAFHERYGLPFVPIANGVDPAHWAPVQLRPGGPVSVRYAGGLAENMTLETVAMVARAVERLAASGLDISFEIRTHSHWQSASAGFMEGLEHTIITTSDLPIEEYRRWLAAADILLIAYNFDPHSRDYIRYSLANKLPDCLASGAAVLAVGPDDVGTIAMLGDLDVSERVTEPDVDLLDGALRRLAASPEERFEMGRRAQQLAFSTFHVRHMREAFEAAVSRVASSHRATEYPRDLHAQVDELAAVASALDGVASTGDPPVDGGQGGSYVVTLDHLGWTVQSRARAEDVHDAAPHG